LEVVHLLEAQLKLGFGVYGGSSMANSLTPLEVNSLKPILEELYRKRPLSSYTTGKRIPLSDGEVCIIYRGVARTQILQDGGEESILGLVGPMMPLSSSFTLLDAYEVYALTHVDLIRLRCSEVQKSGVLMRELNLMLIQRLRRTEALLALQGKRQTSERLIGFLSFLAQEYGRSTAQGIRLEIQLSHQQIADAISTTRVTITKLLGLLRKASLIEVGPNRHLHIMGELFNRYKVTQEP
jgi:CRP-like cAMP-binding protein